jgi:hypothetical protein
MGTPSIEASARRTRTLATTSRIRGCARRKRFNGGAVDPTPPPNAPPPPSSPQGLLVLLGILVVVALVAWWALGDAWMRWFAGA